MAVRLRKTRGANAGARRTPSGLTLLRAGETKLREGNPRAALKVFRRLVEGYPPSLEGLAAASYLRNA